MGYNVITSAELIQALRANGGVSNSITEMIGINRHQVENFDSDNAAVIRQLSNCGEPSQLLLLFWKRNHLPRQAQDKRNKTQQNNDRSRRPKAFRTIRRSLYGSIGRRPSWAPTPTVRYWRATGR